MTSSCSKFGSHEHARRGRGGRKPDIEMYVPRALRRDSYAPENGCRDGHSPAAAGDEETVFTPEVSPQSSRSASGGLRSCTLLNWRKPKAPVRKPSDVDKGRKGAVRERAVVSSRRSFSSSTNGSPAAADKAEQSPSITTSSSSSTSSPATSAPSSSHQHQPHVKKVPSQVIEEMCKRYHVNTTGPATAAESPSNGTTHEKKLKANVNGDMTGIRRTLPTEKVAAVSSADDHQMKIKRCFDGQQSPGIVSKNEADSILQILPMTYDEFESKEATTAANTCYIKSASGAADCDVSAAAAGGAKAATGTPTADNGTCLDPADLEVEMINSSFEAQQSMNLMYQNQRLKDLFYLHPNSSSAGKTAINPPGLVQNYSDNQAPRCNVPPLFSFDSDSLHTIHVSDNGHASSSSMFPAAGITVVHIDPNSTAVEKLRQLPLEKQHSSGTGGGGLTWAGWKNSKITGTGGAGDGGLVGPSPPLQSSRQRPVRELPRIDAAIEGSSTSCTFTDTAGVSTEESLNLSRIADSLANMMLAAKAAVDPVCGANNLTAVSEGTHPAAEGYCFNLNQAPTVATLPSGVERFVAPVLPSTSSSDVNHDTTKQLDLLSIEMVEKILNEDDQPSANNHGSGGGIGCGPGSSPAGCRRFSTPPPPSTTITATKAFAASASDYSTGSHFFCDIHNQEAANDQPVDSWEELVDLPPGDILDFEPAKEDSTSLSRSSRNFMFETADVDDPLETRADEDDLGHILEAYDISPRVQTETLYLSLKQQNCRNFIVEWVDSSHALVQFRSKAAASDVLRNAHLAVKLRPLSRASSKTREAACRLKDVALYSAPSSRPETSAFLARRLVESHLGIRPTARTKELRRQEKLVLDQARDKKKASALVREELWEGKI